MRDDGGKRKREQGGVASAQRHRAADGGGGHDVVSAGGFEDRRKYRVDAETVKYFQEIGALVAPKPAAGGAAAASAEPEEEGAAEQRAAMVRNALEETAGRELHLALDPTCSHVVQSLLCRAPAPSLVAYLTPFGSGGMGVTLVTNPFGSHVSETLFGALRAALAPDAAPERETLAAAREALQLLCDQLAARTLHLVAHRAASPALRALLGLLSGCELGRRDGKADGKAERERPDAAAVRAGGAPAAADAAAAPPTGRRFGKLLARFVDGCLTALEDSGEFWQYVADPACSAFLQAVAAAYEGEDAALRRTLPRLLGAPRLDDGAAAPADGECFALAPPSHLGELLRDAAGSRLAEALLRVAPRGMRHELYARFMAGSLPALSSHACANFAVQAYLRALTPGDTTQLAAALGELAPQLGALLTANRGGVVCALLAACAAVGACHKEAAQALSRALLATYRDALALPPAATGERDNSAYVAVLAPSLLRRVAGSTTKGGFSAHGCAALSALLAFPPATSRQYADSLAAIAPAEAAAAACDPAASRALEAMLRGGAPPGLKRKLLATLQPRWAALAVNPAGSHVVDAAYDGAEPREREALVGALAAAERTLAASRYGTALLRRLGVSEFRHDPVAWRRRHAAAAQVRAAFADLLADTPVAGKPAAGNAPAAPAAAPRPQAKAPGKASRPDKEAAALSGALQKAIRELR